MRGPKRCHAFVTLLLLALLWARASHGSLGERTTLLNEPYQEWALEYPGAAGDKYDVIASALFTHEGTGETRTSLMFYAGTGDTWKFRFTGPRLGRWNITTTGPGALGGQTGVVTVVSNPVPRNGFLRADGRRWYWAGAQRHTVPQFVMGKAYSAFWTGNSVNTGLIEEDLQEFITETGFGGMHFEGGGRWFDISRGGVQTGDSVPDQRTFQVVDQLLVRCYLRGGAVHLWLWGSDGFGASSGPKNIGGTMSAVEQRLIRYIAARLGPLPGWSMGYGFDLKEWASASQLQAWYTFTVQQLGGWEHIIGARADNLEWFNSDGSVRRDPLSLVYWTGDYAGYYDYRVPYAWYAQCFDYFNKPHFSEDRFRIRVSSQWERKDYTPELTRRGLWHSVMAGGVANIWGNLLPHNSNSQGSSPYNNNASATIQGVSFTVNMKHQIRTHREFWLDRNRYSADLVRDNALTGNVPGGDVISIQFADPISVCLRNSARNRYIFYSEKASTVRMDLSQSGGPLPAVAVDTRLAYAEIPLGMLAAQVHQWTAPYESDWAIAVGTFDGAAPPRCDTPPAAPTNVSALPGIGQIALSWSSDPCANSYTVFRDGEAIAAGLTGTNYTDQAVVAGVNYCYAVRGINTNGPGPLSANVCAEPLPPGAPSTPTGLGAQAGDQWVQLSWNAVATATAYVVERSVAGDGYVAVGTNAATGYLDAGLINGITYCYRVKAVNEYGSSPVTSGVCAMPAAAPGGLGLVGHWAFEEGSGMTTADLSGRGNTGTLVGAVLWTNGIVGDHALNFPGLSSARVEMSADSASLQITGALTLAAWVWPGVANQSAHLVGRAGGGGARGYQLITEGAGGDATRPGAFGLRLSSNGLANAAVTLYTPTNIMKANEWMHVAGVFDPSTTPSTMRIYTNGVLCAEMTTPSKSMAVPAGIQPRIGARGDNTGGFNGRIDEARIYNRALGAAEVLELYRGGVVPPAPEIHWIRAEGMGADTVVTIAARGVPALAHALQRVGALDGAGWTNLQWRVASTNDAEWGRLLFQDTNPPSPALYRVWRPATP